MQDNSKLITTFFMLTSETVSWIKDFEKIMLDQKYRDEIPTADKVYMYVIIINLSQIFNWTESDKYWIKQIKNCCSQKDKDRIEKIEKDNNGLIEKIKNNRNSSIAHTFWEEENSRLLTSLRTRERDSIEHYKWIPIPSEDRERYSSLDMLEDLPKISTILSQLQEIWHAFNQSNYKKLTAINS